MHRTLTHCLLISVLLVIASCAGYRFQEKSNPFAQYGVRSISVPMFYNQSTFPGISSPVTKEIFQMLSTFSGVKVVSGKAKADAVLIGIIASPKTVRDSYRPEDLRSAKNAVGDVTGERNDFYVPANTRLSARLRLILVKNPSDREIELLKTSMGRFAVGPRIIMNETLGLSGGFTRELYGGNGMDVNDTQNRSARTNTLEEMAQGAAQNFRDMILYAF